MDKLNKEEKIKKAKKIIIAVEGGIMATLIGGCSLLFMRQIQPLYGVREPKKRNSVDSVYFNSAFINYEGKIARFTSKITYIYC